MNSLRIILIVLGVIGLILLITSSSFMKPVLSCFDMSNVSNTFQFQCIGFWLH
ncbi:Uncharacterised protein [Candidatus Tiddalikarchaeum anstoanum]|nr:Uncharacterised protein [Candidatus Tiddalikarchaeum anstoanum]